MNLTETDISACKRCGSTKHVWHIWGKGDRQDEIVGSVCTRCLWACGEANIITAISCKIEELRLNAARAAGERERRKRTYYRIRKLIKKWRRNHG